MLNNFYNQLYVADAHADTATVCGGNFYDNPERHLDFVRLKQFVNLQVFAFFQKPEQQPWLEWQHICRYYDDFANAVLGFAGMDILNNKIQLLDESRTWAVAALESVDCFAWFDDKRFFLDTLKKMNFKIIGLFWNNNNWAGSGADCNQPKKMDLGLTRKGKRFLELFAEYYFVLDLAHSSQRSFDDVCQIYKKPIMVSHTCCGALHPHRRNLTDRQLKIIGERQGYVGIACFPYFLNGTPWAEIDDVAEHICHAVNCAGIDAVGLGTDFDGIEFLPSGMSGCQSLPLLADKLEKKGLKYKEIEKIMGKNLQSFLLYNLE